MLSAGSRRRLLLLLLRFWLVAWLLGWLCRSRCATPLVAVEDRGQADDVNHAKDTGDDAVTFVGYVGGENEDKCHGDEAEPLPKRSQQVRLPDGLL